MQRPHPANPRLTGEDRRHDAQRGAGVDHRVQVDLAGQGTEGHVLDHRHRPHARDQRRFAGAPRTAHRLEGYGREVLAFRNGVGHVQGPTATRLESETPFQLLVHRFGVLVRGQHRALLGLRSVQLDQEPLAWVVVSQLFQSTVHIVAPLPIRYPRGPVRATFVYPSYVAQWQVYTRKSGTRGLSRLSEYG